MSVCFIFFDHYNALNVHDHVNNHIDMKYKDLSYRAENMGQQFLHLPHFKNLSIPKNQSHSISSPVALFHVWQVRYFSSPQWFDFARKQSRSKISLPILNTYACTEVRMETCKSLMNPTFHSSWLKSRHVPFCLLKYGLLSYSYSLGPRFCIIKPPYISLSISA